jgi:zinc/manganese transport system permease protein
MMLDLNPVSLFQQVWQYQFMQHAIETSLMISIVAGVTGYFVVLRRSAFVAHAYSEIGFAGASAAILVGMEPLLGLLLGSVAGGIAISALGRRMKDRDTQIGIVLAFALGLGLLFISLYKAFSTAAISILFGEILGISTSEVQFTFIAGAGILLAMGFLHRPLLFASLDEEVAEAKGMPLLFLGTAFMLIVAVAVSVAIQVTGVLLIFSLMVTPAATAQYLSRRPQWAIMISVGISLVATQVGLVAAYFSPYPVSFFITGFVFVLYLLVRLAQGLAQRRTQPRPRAAPA